MHARTTRVFFAGGLLHLGLGGALALATAARAPVDARAHLVLLASALAQVAAALVLGLLPAFLRRDWPAPLLALAAMGLAVLGDLAWIAATLAGRDDALRMLMALHGCALVLAALHAPLLLTGARWPAGESLFAPTQPFRQGDSIVAGAFATALGGLLAGGVLLVAAPREQPHAALAVLVLAAVLPAALGATTFVLPREAKARWSGATLVGFSMLLFAAAALTFAVGFARPLSADLRAPAWGALLAWLLLGVAASRQRAAAAAGGRLARARPLLLAGAIVGILGAIVLVLSVPGGLPNNLLPLALDAHLVAGLLLLGGAAILAAPLALPGDVRGERWPRVVAALLIAGLFLLSPSFQYERSAFPGAFLLALAVAALVLGLARLARAPSRATRAMRRR